MDKLEQAIPLFEEAAAGVEKRGFKHENAERIFNNVVNCHERLKRFDRAELWRRKWLAAVKEQSGASSGPYAGELLGLGRDLIEQRKWIEAESVLRECLSVFEEKEAGRSITFNAQALLGESLAGQNKYSEAEPLLLKAYEGLAERARTNPDPARRRFTHHTGERIIQLYEAWVKSAQAAKWKAKVEKPNAVPASASGSNEAR